MEIPEDDPEWQDHPFDNQGRSVRVDVRQGAWEVWPACCARSRSILGAVDIAAFILEDAAEDLSLKLNSRRAVPSLQVIKRSLRIRVLRDLNMVAEWDKEEDEAEEGREKAEAASAGVAEAGRVDQEFLAQLPPDLDPGERELLEVFDDWIHATHPNPKRLG